MRTMVRWLAVAAILIAVFLTASHLYRDSIARGVANKYLQQHGVSVVDVSINALETDRVRFERISLEFRSGATVEVFDVSLPYDAATQNRKTLDIGRIAVSPGADSATPMSPADVYTIVADAAPTVPAASISIGWNYTPSNNFKTLFLKLLISLLRP